MNRQIGVEGFQIWDRWQPPIYMSCDTAEFFRQKPLTVGMSISKLLLLCIVAP